MVKPTPSADSREAAPRDLVQMCLSHMTGVAANRQSLLPSDQIMGASIIIPRMIRVFGDSLVGRLIDLFEGDENAMAQVFGPRMGQVPALKVGGALEPYIVEGREFKARQWGGAMRNPGDIFPMLDRNHHLGNKWAVAIKAEQDKDLWDREKWFEYSGEMKGHSRELLRELQALVVFEEHRLLSELMLVGPYMKDLYSPEYLNFAKGVERLCFLNIVIAKVDKERERLFGENFRTGVGPAAGKTRDEYYFPVKSEHIAHQFSWEGSPRGSSNRGEYHAAGRFYRVILNYPELAGQILAVVNVMKEAGMMDKNAFISQICDLVLNAPLEGDDVPETKNLTLDGDVRDVAQALLAESYESMRRPLLAMFPKKVVKPEAAEQAVVVAEEEEDPIAIAAEKEFIAETRRAIARISVVVLEETNALPKKRPILGRFSIPGVGFDDLEAEGFRRVVRTKWDEAVRDGQLESVVPRIGTFKNDILELKAFVDGEGIVPHGLADCQKWQGRNDLSNVLQAILYSIDNPEDVKSQEVLRKNAARRLGTLYKHLGRFRGQLELFCNTLFTGSFSILGQNLSILQGTREIKSNEPSSASVLLSRYISGNEEKFEALRGRVSACLDELDDSSINETYLDISDIEKELAEIVKEFRVFFQSLVAFFGEGEGKEDVFSHVEGLERYKHELFRDSAIIVSALERILRHF